MKLTVLEHTAVLVAAGGLGAKVLVGTQLWLYALIAGLLVAGVSFVYRQGWKPSR